MPRSSTSRRSLRNLRLNLKEVFDLNELNTDTSLEALIIFLLQLNIILTQLDLVFNLLDLLCVSWEHHARDSLLIRIHLLSNAWWRRIDPVKFCVFPSFFPERQLMCSKFNTLDLKDLIIIQCYSDVLSLKFIDVSLDVQVKDFRIDWRDCASMTWHFIIKSQLQFLFLLLRLLFDIHFNNLYLIFYLFLLEKHLVALTTEVLLKLDELISVLTSYTLRLLHRVHDSIPKHMLLIEYRWLLLCIHWNHSCFKLLFILLVHFADFILKINF